MHVVRDPLAVAASLAARDGIAPSEALALWERYTRDAFEASRGWPRVLVDYDALCTEPLAATRALHEQLRALGLEGVRMPPPDAVREWIDAPSHLRRAHDAELSVAQRALRDAIADRSILLATPRRDESSVSLDAGTA